MTATEAAELVASYWRLALKVANKWGASYPSLRAELESEATFVLWRTATEYDPAAGVKFATRYLRVVTWRLIRFVDEQRRHNRPLSEAVGQVERDGEFAPLVDYLADQKAESPDARAERADDLCRLTELLNGLPPDRRALVELHVAGGESLESLADVRGLSREAVGGRVKAGLRKLRVAAGTEGG